MRLSGTTKRDPKPGRVEVALRSLSARYRDLCGSLAGGLRRLVAAAGLDPQAAALRRRLVGVLLLSPIVLAGAIVLVLPPAAGIAAAGIVLALSWLAGLTVAQHGREVPFSLLGLAVSTVVVALLIAAGGGLASPLCLLLAALTFEPWWIWRTGRAARIGLAASAVGIGVAALAGHGFFAGAEPAAWHWLPPLLYLLAVTSRLARDLQQARDDEPSMEDRTGVAVLALGANGDVLHQSARAGDVLGLAPELVADQAFFERLHVGDRVGYMCALSDLRNGAAHRSAELRVRLPQADSRGESYRLMLADFVASSKDGNGCRLILRPGDDLQALRAKLAGALEEVDRLTLAKSSFLASVSHELRTPLNAIIGFSDMLVHELYGSFADARQKEQVSLIRDAGTHLLGVVNSILDVSKLELGAYEINPEPFRFADAVEMCASMMAMQAASKGITLETRLDSEIGEINADRRAIQQMLINLISNAIKFTPAGGEVAIGASLDGDAVEFRVRDNGAGIAEADMARLGQPFVQLSADYARRHDGTGLGLALVKGLVRLHEGTLTVTSLLGSGTTVTIRLPKAGPEGSELAALTGRLAPAAMHEEVDGAYRKTA